MAISLIPSITPQDIIHTKEGTVAAGYWAYFYDKETHNKRPAYRKKEDGSAIEVENPLQLDENGMFPYKLYYSVDLTNIEDRYRVYIRCQKGEASPAEFIFEMPFYQNAPNVDPTSSLLSDNLFIDGQFNFALSIPDPIHGDGYLDPAFPQVPIAGNSWIISRPYADSVPPAARVDKDRFFVKQITEAEKILEGDPRFYVNYICESFDNTNPPLEKVIAFHDSNVLWGAGSLIKLKFQAWRAGDDIPLKIELVQNFGSKSTTQPKLTELLTVTIDNDRPKVYSKEFNIDEVIIPADIGEDQYLILRFVLPLNAKFDFKATNFHAAVIDAPIATQDFKYPMVNADLSRGNLLMSSIKSSKYTIDDAFCPVVFSLGGLQFLNEVGEIVKYPKGAKVDETKINLMKCDGRTLSVDDTNPIGVAYKRLYNKLGLAPRSFNMLQTEETPNWFNAISSEYIKQFAIDHGIITDFSSYGSVLSKFPQGETGTVAMLWLESTFWANMAVDDTFQYVASGAGITTQVICHTFDITTNYDNSSHTAQDQMLYETQIFGGDINHKDIPGYFRTGFKYSLIPFSNESKPSYIKGVDEAVKCTTAKYVINGSYLDLNISIKGFDFGYTSAVSTLSQTYDSVSYNVGFPFYISGKSVTFGQNANNSRQPLNLNYFLFSGWRYVQEIQKVNNDRIYAPNQAEMKPLSKGWDDNEIYHKDSTKSRVPKQPNILYGVYNSCITYAIQHKALFTQRCLYGIRPDANVQASYIGLKTQENTATGNNFNVVFWHDQAGDTPPTVNAQKFVRVVLTDDEVKSAVLIADKYANAINTSGSGIFSIPKIEDDKFDHYIRY